ncbi:MAG TPA: protoporphyrinogen oxidase [Acidimicrobiales bacterium]|nr:protoporphyrinogen oxidase [Acidimicrobiales bacterium]
MTTGSDSTPRRRILVVGGGVSGLVAARELASSFDVIIAEAADTTGGKIRTVEFRGRPLDVGPDVFITRNPEAEQLCRQLGLDDELVAPSSSSAAVWARGSMRPLPKGLAVGIPTDLTALWRSTVVSPRDVVRAATDLIPRRPVTPPSFGRAAKGGADASIADIVRPRLGGAVFDTLVAPLLGGINAGRAEELSFEATAPELARAVAGKWRLMPALRRFASGSGRTPARPIFLGLEPGLATLVQSLEQDCSSRGVKLERAAPVARLRRLDDDRWRALVAGREQEFGGVLLAVSAGEAARLLDDEAPELAGQLSAIPYAGVVTVTFAWPRSALPSGGNGRLVGSGALVPRGTTLTTALTFVSTKWPRSANPGELVIRSSAGRYGDERALESDDGELVRRIREEIRVFLGIKEPPLDVHVERFPASFPQYVVGHLRRVDRIEQLADELGGIALTGSWTHGVGIPSCIGEAKRAAAKLAAEPAR